MLRGGRLTALQKRLLVVLAELSPPWTLTGGAALAGFHLGHRDTRDLDLFFRGRQELPLELLRELERLVDAEGLAYERLSRGPAFTRYRVDGAGERVVVDLVAEPVAALEPAERLEVDDPRGPVAIAVDSAHEILVNKLNTLVSRTELRDLVDVGELLRAGGDLDRAIVDAAKKDGGFSPLVLADCLATFPVATLAERSGRGEAETHELARSAAALAATVARRAFPETS